MSSSYSDAIISVLKDAMLQREANNWRFTQEDIVALTVSTQLTAAEIVHWETSAIRRSAETIKNWLEQHNENVGIY